MTVHPIKPTETDNPPNSHKTIQLTNQPRWEEWKHPNNYHTSSQSSSHWRILTAFQLLNLSNNHLVLTIPPGRLSNSVNCTSFYGADTQIHISPQKFQFLPYLCQLAFSLSSFPFLGRVGCAWTLFSEQPNKECLRENERKGEKGREKERKWEGVCLMKAGFL